MLWTTDCGCERDCQMFSLDAVKAVDFSKPIYDRFKSGRCLSTHNICEASNRTGCLSCDRLEHEAHGILQGESQTSRSEIG